MAQFASSVLAFVVAIVSALLAPCLAEKADSYLIISSPATAKIFYARLLTAKELAKNQALTVKELTTAGQIQDPRGVAVDTARAALYVASPSGTSIYGCRMAIKDDGSRDLVISEAPKKVVNNVNAKWIAIDGTGTLFFSDSEANEIKSVPSVNLTQALQTGNAVEGAAIRKIYSVAGPPAITMMKSPQGVAVDNFKLMWANGENGQESGTVTAGEEVPPESGTGAEVSKLAWNEDAAWGVCLSGKFLHYTAGTKIYGMRHKGGEVTVVNKDLSEPRGCSWDGDGTMYVADKSGPAKSGTAGAVYSFPANPPGLRSMLLEKAIEVPDAYDVAVFSAAVRARFWAAALAAAALALAGPLR